jgi:hypothetical protein
MDFLTALEQWVEHGRAPQQVAATKKDSALSWPVCAYPALPRGEIREGKVVYACK